MSSRWRMRGLTDSQYGDWHLLAPELAVILTGPLGQIGLTSRARDVLRVGVAVHAVERGLPAAMGTNRPAAFDIELKLEEPGYWSVKAIDALAGLLAFQGDADWHWTMRAGGKAAGGVDVSRTRVDSRAIHRVALFSAGLDSTSGIALSREEAPFTQLVSHYARQKSKQAEISKQLTYHPPSQARIRGLAGRGRAFYYRSFYFLTLAAAVASSYRIRQITQYENGILAAAVPPAPAYFMTRHAHPTTHRLAERLFASVLGGKWTIDNPFLGQTKGECVRELVTQFGQRHAMALIRKTETCWYLYSNQLAAKRKKLRGKPCGVCIPCIVRRAAIKTSEGEYDLNKREVRADRILGRDFEAYRIFTARASDSAANQRLFLELPTYVRDLAYGANAPFTPAQLVDLLQRFAAEFNDAFRT